MGHARACVCVYTQLNVARASSIMHVRRWSIWQIWLFSRFLLAHELPCMRVPSGIAGAAQKVLCVWSRQEWEKPQPGVTISTSGIERLRLLRATEPGRLEGHCSGPHQRAASQATSSPTTPPCPWEALCMMPRSSTHRITHASLDRLDCPVASTALRVPAFCFHLPPGPAGPV